MSKNEELKYPPIYVTPQTRDDLGELAGADLRSVPKEVAWLVEAEVKRRTEAERARGAVAEDVPPAS